MKCPECSGNVKWHGDATQMDCPYCQASIVKPAPSAPPPPPAPQDPIRSMLETKAGIATRDIFEGMGQGSAVDITSTTRVESMFIVNGVQYESLDDMPASVRAQFDQATHTLGFADMFALPKAIEGSRSATMPHGAPAERSPGAGTAVKAAVKGRATMNTNAQNAAAAEASEKSALNVAIYAVLGIIALFLAGGIAVWLVSAAR